MLLTIDIGNSDIVVGAYPLAAESGAGGQDEDAPVASWRLPTFGERAFQGPPHREEGENAARSSLPTSHSCSPHRQTLERLWRESGLSAADFQDAALCSVVAPLTPLWRGMLAEMLNRDPLVLHQRLNLGMTLAVARPDKVGMDRLADAVAVRRRTAGAAVAVDFGTATTFNVVDARGRFCGGAIAPGLGTVADALAAQAPALPTVELTPPASVVGRDTIAALQSGIVLGYTGLVEGLLARIGDELDAPLSVIATGGFGRIISPLTNAIDDFDPWLTLAGIRALYRLNRERREA